MELWRKEVDNHLITYYGDVLKTFRTAFISVLSLAIQNLSLTLQQFQ